MTLLVEDIKKMTVEERLRSIEMLKISLSPTDDEDDTPEWHKEILAERMARINAGEEKFYTLAEVRAEIAQRRQGR